MNLPNYENDLKELLIRESVRSVIDSSNRVLRDIVDEKQDFLEANIDLTTRIQNEERLSSLKYENVSSVFIVFFREGGQLHYLLDGSKGENKGEFLEPFQTPYIKLVKNIYQTKQQEVVIQKGLNEVGFTLIKPVIQNNRVVALMFVDYTQNTFARLIYRIKKIINGLMITIMVFMAVASIYMLYLAIDLYRRFKAYTVPKTKALYRSFLTDNYERINFTNYYIALADIDRFKRINDLYGERVGDKIIHMVLKKIGKFIEDEDGVIRYGGEEFLLLIAKSSHSVIDFKQKMEEIRQTIEEYVFKVDGIEESITLSIGTLIETESVTSLQSAIQNADIALYFAKHNGRNRVCHYDLSDEKRLYREKLKEMIEADQLICHYQPIANLYTREYHHYEALLRIEDNDSIIYPDKILPDLEDSYFYSKISMKVIEFNVKKLREEIKLIASVNLSSDDLLNSDVHTLLEESKDVADRMFIEILETKGVDYGKVEGVIQHLKVLGYKICIDDFGSGYANLEHLFSLSIDYLKLDGSIIKSLHIDKRAHSIIQAITLFCRQNDIEVIAEYVENREVVELLKQFGIKYGQGYYFDKAKPFEELEF